MDFDITGATSRSPSDTTALKWVKPTMSGGTAPMIQLSKATVLTVTAGSNTFTAKYKSDLVTSGAEFRNREIFVMNLA